MLSRDHAFESGRQCSMRSNGLGSSLRILRIFPFTNGKKKIMGVNVS